MGDVGLPALGCGAPRFAEYDGGRPFGFMAEGAAGAAAGGVLFGGGVLLFSVGTDAAEGVVLSVRCSDGVEMPLVVG